MTPREREDYAKQLRKRLRQRPACIQLQNLAASGGFSDSWLRAFQRGEYSNPHVRLLLQLDKTLTKACEEIA